MRSAPRPVSPALLFLTVALAGCLAAPPGGPDGDPGTTPPLGTFANVQVTNVNGPASEVTVAKNPVDPLNLIGGAKDYTLGSDPGPGCTEYNVWSGAYWSKDGGATWGNFLMPGYPGDANTTLLSRYTCNSDPVVAFGADGVAYYSGLAYGGGAESVAGTGLCPSDSEARLCGRSIWTARSEDGGVTWQDFVNVAVGDGSNTILDKQWFATDPTNAGNLVMTWIDFNAPGGVFLTGSFFIAASFDGARSWTPPALLAETSLPIHQFAMPQFGPQGEVYVIWRNFGGLGLGGLPLPAQPPLGLPGTAQIMFTANVPGTPGFPPAIGIQPVVDIDIPNAEYRTGSAPILAVDTSGGERDGNLYIAWPDGRNGHADILLIRSEDGGLSWSPPVVVNQDGTQNDQFMNWITVDEEGGVNVVFYDRSRDPGNARLDIGLARSTDGGVTWSHLYVTPAPWVLPEGCYHQAGFPFLGDYIGLAAGDGLLHPFWADGRTGRCEVFTAAVPYTAFGAAAAP